MDAGFEFGVLNDRITGEFAVYNKESRDVLLRTSSPSSSGFKEYWQNIGHIRNRGVELGITSYNLTGALKWKTTLNIARNRNLVETLARRLLTRFQAAGIRVLYRVTLSV